MLSVVLAGCFGDEPAPAPEDDPYTPPAQPEDSGSLPADATLAQTGRWQAPFDGEVPAINMVLLHTGDVLYWSGVEARDESDPDWTFFTSYPEEGVSRVLDLGGDSPVVVAPGTPDGAGEDLFCAGQTILPDGRVLTVGSSEWHTQPDSAPQAFLTGGQDARLFDPVTQNWTAASEMALGRWYPSVIRGADGDPLVVSGILDLTDYDDIWREWETWNASEDSWSKVDGIEALLPLYPRMTVVPGGPLKGDVFYNTVATLWGPFGEHPEQAEWSYQKTFDVDAGTWRDLDLSVYGARQHGASVMLPLDPADGYAPEFVTFGGTLYQSVLATPFTERNDLSTDPPTNAPAAMMNNPRWHLNGVGLPDGSVLAVGGGLYDNVVLHGQENVPVMEPELYDPDTDTWTVLAPMQVERMYHSTAILLPDATVLVGGHVPLPNPFPTARDTVNPQVTEKRLEVFEPPYLFRGERPVVWGAPDHVGYGEDFDVLVNATGGDLDSLVLVSPGATTHSFDANQRTIVLDWEAGDGHNVTVTAPPDGDVAPPGWYMLFANKAHPDGPVPSEAAWVHIA